ncbi:MAG: hypothetical protein AB1646_02900 [Thermodesulfobacteriota bacterium]
MVANELLGFALGIVCALVLAVFFLLGDIVGLVVETRLTRRWEIMSERMGLAFDGGTEPCRSLSELLVPKLTGPGVEQSAFCYGESLRSLQGSIGHAALRIHDFAVWNFHIRGPLVFRAIVCVVETDRAAPNGECTVVCRSSVLADGFRRSPDLSPCEFPEEPEFSDAYVAFAKRFAPPWVISDEIRRFCVANRGRIDCLTVRSRDAVLCWAGRNPEGFPALVKLATALVATLQDDHPPRAGGRKNRA